MSRGLGDVYKRQAVMYLLNQEKMLEQDLMILKKFTLRKEWGGRWKKDMLIQYWINIMR